MQLIKDGLHIFVSTTIVLCDLLCIVNVMLNVQFGQYEKTSGKYFFSCSVRWVND